MAEPPNSRPVGRRETREALIQAGMAELAGQGLKQPSLDAICARAGFTRGAFYVHFEDREDFIAAVMERVLGGFLDARDRPAAASTTAQTPLRASPVRCREPAARSSSTG